VPDVFAGYSQDHDLGLTEQPSTDLDLAREALHKARLSLRALPLPQFDPLIEPATALRWIDNGGRSS
jgi:hypothetical protein